MQLSVILENVAILVRHWYEVGPDSEEHGTRVELRTVARPAHLGSESAAQPVTLGEPLWRADIFDLIGESPGNLARAHFHPSFDGLEPCGRHWDPRLRADWAGWLRDQLANLPAVLAAAGAPGSLAVGTELLADPIDALLTAAAGCLGVHCDAGERCLAATRDTRTAVAMMMAAYRAPGSDDPRRNVASNGIY